MAISPPKFKPWSPAQNVKSTGMPPGQSAMALGKPSAPSFSIPAGTPKYGSLPTNPGEAFAGAKLGGPLKTTPIFTAAGNGPGMINGDWEVADAEAMMASQMARARGDFTAGMRRGLVDLGLGDVSKLGSLGQYIDADTIKNAVANKYSQTAQIAQKEQRGRAVNNAALAARGMLRSGQTTKSQQDVSNEAESLRYGALRDYLSGAETGLMGLGDREAQLAQGVAQARYSAAARLANLYPGAWGQAQNTGLVGFDIPGGGQGVMSAQAPQTFDPTNAYFRPGGSQQQGATFNKRTGTYEYPVGFRPF